MIQTNSSGNETQLVGPATTQNLVVKFDGEICGRVLVEKASDDFPQQKKLENLLPNFAGSSPPISSESFANFTLEIAGAYNLFPYEEILGSEKNHKHKQILESSPN